MPQSLFIELPTGIREMDLEVTCTKSNCTLVSKIHYHTGPVYEIEAGDPLDFYRLGIAVAAKQLENGNSKNY